MISSHESQISDIQVALGDLIYTNTKHPTTMKWYSTPFIYIIYNMYIYMYIYV